MKQLSKQNYIDLYDGTIDYEQLPECHCPRLPMMEEALDQAIVKCRECKKLEAENKRVMEENKILREIGKLCCATLERYIVICNDPTLNKLANNIIPNFLKILNNESEAK